MEHQQIQHNRGGGKIWVWVLVILAAAYFLSSYSGTSSETTSSGNFLTNLLAPAEKEDTTIPTIPTVPVTNTTTNTTTEPETPPEPVKVCGSLNYGLPDYTGTSKEGQTCADAIASERDLECVANPPTNYDGTIQGSSSSPLLLCCDAVGKCYW
tara:strand:- start:3911 stop:4372 length:462 start_codon:yes stop_codon:yes gene_type:complete